MQVEAYKFKSMFKKYRLKAEFDTLSKLGLALAGKGIIYEDSIFSHWQKGNRIPQNRIVLLKLIEIFIERNAIETINQANEFLSSAGLGYLSEDELQKIPIKLYNPIFQVPNEIIHFSGRKEIITNLVYQTDIRSKVIFIHGPAGIGKTALAIKLGHVLKDRYKDGVLWYKVEEDNIMDILLSIARIFGEDISRINDLQVRATIARSLLTSKKVLLFLDSAELSDDVHLIIPNSEFCTTIITSQKNYLKTPIKYIDIKLETFTDKEILFLFKEVLKEKYPQNNTENILKIAKTFGNLPLALHILARQLLHSEISLIELSKTLGQENSVLQDLYYADKNLYSAIAISYSKLDNKMQSVLLSASIFKGKDFSINSIAYINGLSIPMTNNILHNLTNLSLIEHSTKNRFRIHPAIREFVRYKLDNPRSSYLIFIAIFIFIFFSMWWIMLQLFVDKGNFIYLIFSATYGLMLIYGGICGIHTSLKWGGLKTLLGRAIFMFSLGLFAQEFGQLTYSYYTIFYQIQVPYPSIGDIGFSSTILLYTYGVWLLAKSSGININIHMLKKNLLALIIPFFMLTVSYLLFIKNYEVNFETPVKTLLDFGFPLGESLCIAIAILIFIFSRNILDGIMRSKALWILFALVIQFIVDYIFIYYSNIFYPGSIIDFMYLISYFIMTLALLSLKSLQVEVKTA